MSGGARMGTTTKIISKASSTGAHSPTKPSSSAAVAWCPSGESAASWPSHWSVPQARNTRLKVVAPTSRANSAPLRDRLSLSSSRQSWPLSSRLTSAHATARHPAVAAASTARTTPVKTAVTSRATAAITASASRRARRLKVGASSVPVRAWRQATSAQPASTSRAGTSAARRMSCVLTMRAVSVPANQGRRTASVCALSMASPSSSNTREGGTTTPRAAEALISASARAGATPASRGPTSRVSMLALAATEPFIGATSAATPSVASAGAARVRRAARVSSACRLRASVRRCSSNPMKAYSGNACSRSFSSRPTSRPGRAPSSAGST